MYTLTLHFISYYINLHYNIGHVVTKPDKVNIGITKNSEIKI